MCVCVHVFPCCWVGDLGPPLSASDAAYFDEFGRMWTLCLKIVRFGLSVQQQDLSISVCNFNVACGDSTACHACPFPSSQCISRDVCNVCSNAGFLLPGSKAAKAYSTWTSGRNLNLGGAACFAIGVRTVYVSAVHVVDICCHGPLHLQEKDQAREREEIGRERESYRERGTDIGRD